MLRLAQAEHGEQLCVVCRTPGHERAARLEGLCGECSRMRYARGQTVEASVAGDDRYSPAWPSRGFGRCMVHGCRRWAITDERLCPACRKRWRKIPAARRPSIGQFAAAANALANPRRALRILPGALYELGMAVAVSVSLAPQLIQSVQRVARARRLRGGRSRGLRALRSIAIPVLADALDRSLMLAAAMDSRGYGRSGPATPRTRHVTGGLMIVGMAGLCVGAYGLLDGTAPRVLGAPALLAGAVVCCAGLALGGRRVTRSRYRPDPWRAPEWIVATSGLACAAMLYVSANTSASAVAWTFEPLRFPPLPVLPALAILIGAIPASAAPSPIRPGAPATGAGAGPGAAEGPADAPARAEELVA